MEERIIDTNIIEGEDRKLKFREKLACGIGGLSGTFHYEMIQIFLLFFYTDIMKISVAYVGGLFLVVRVLSAVSAPVFAVFVDRVTTPWGKYKPWFIILGVPFGIFGFLTYTNMGLSPTGKLIYVTITYTIYSLADAFASGPKAAIIPAITKRIDERVSIGQISMMGVMLGAILATIGIQPLYKLLGGGNDSKGFSLLMAGVGIITVLISLFEGFTLKERYIAKVKKDENAPSLKQMFMAVITNKTAVIVYIYMFATNLSTGVKSAVMLYYFKYFFHNENLMVTMGIAALVPSLIGVIISSKVTKIFGIKNNIIIGVIVNVITFAGIMLVPATSTGSTFFLILMGTAGLFNGISTPALATLMPAAMDYTEWKSGLNINAFMGSIQKFLQTLSTALSGALVASALVFVGYVPGAEQNSSTLLGLRVLMSVVPAIIAIFTGAIMWLDLTGEKQAQITKELAQRRKND
ncbi:MULTISPECIES: MFS transporter [Clostridium]|uniref:Glycoside-pentoside-hexuronide (GPH):cation symporter n=1 Tax=Clostridium frigoriphilum TaxID=443253 RepID=A0ABU7UQP6_9CLOT|nr:glycoside-pentoside-hexuronide (GPH):cation symporter [Clostridium sp. DSM 17811]MBU3099401.1 glycoside-pentoside-hexuronide (GPH):cation symporter [Clostridium sp. DSM 17811]